jgi:alpha-1,2-mannosyltransferase
MLIPPWILLSFGIPFCIIFFTPALIQLGIESIGWYFTRKTAGRREQILERVEEEEKAWNENRKKQEPEKGVDGDAEWEKVDGFEAGVAGNGEKGEKEYDGIIGFFHPFW